MNRKKKIVILIPDEQTGPNTISCIVGAYHFFTEANNYYKKLGKHALFEIVLAGNTANAQFLPDMSNMFTQRALSDLNTCDLIIIPAIIANPEKIAKKNNILADWILEQYKHGAEVASMCSGGYLLAATGLLDKKSCSVHWNSAENFRRLFPKVNLKLEKLITDEDGLYTNGGGYSFLNLLLYLIQKFYDRSTAIFCSKIFQVDMDRQSQLDFVIFSKQKSHDDAAIRKAQEYMEAHFDEKISIEQLAKQCNIGRRNFDRRFIKATGNTPLDYLQRVRIEYAKKHLETSRKTIQEIMYKSGYADVKAFREVFRKVTGLSPLEYKSKYGKEMIG